MFYYAQINGNNICVGVSCLHSQMNNEQLIPIENLDNDYIGKKYDRNTNKWIEAKYEPESTAPNNEV